MLKMMTILLACGLSSSAFAHTCSPQKEIQDTAPILVSGVVMSRTATDDGVVNAIYRFFSGGSRRDRMEGSNTAEIRVDKVIKGDVGDVISVTASLDNGANGGFRFPKGPIVLGAYRTPSGELRADLCGYFGGGPRAAEIPWDDILAPDSDQSRRYGVLVAGWKTSKRVIELYKTSTGTLANDRSKLNEIDALLEELGDQERRVKIWKEVFAQSHSADDGAIIAEAFLAQHQYDLALSYAADPAISGSPLAQRIANTVAMIKGLPADPVRAELSGQFFSKPINLDNADLSGRTIRNLHASHVDARDANFSKSDMTDVSLSGGNISGARFDGSKIANVSIYADAANTTFRGATISGQRSSGMVFNSPGLSLTRGGRNADFSMVSGSGLSLQGDFTNAVFEDIEIDNLVLSGADLKNATFKGAQIGHLIMSNTILDGVDLTAAKSIGKIGWRDIKIDCGTRLYGGRTSFEAMKNDNMAKLIGGDWCGQAEVEDETKVATDCDIECLNALIEHPSRRVEIWTTQGTFGGAQGFVFGASFPGRGLCSDEAVKLTRNLAEKSRARIDDLMAASDFCPVAVPSHFFNGPVFSDLDRRMQEAVHPIMRGQGQKSINPLYEDLDRFKYFDLSERKNVAIPRLIEFLNTDTEFRSSVLAMVPKEVSPLGEELISLILKEMEHDGFNNGDSNIAARFAQTTYQNPEMRTAVLNALLDNPSVRDKPAYLAFSKMHERYKPRRLSP